jgi:hypothetical protein
LIAGHLGPGTGAAPACALDRRARGEGRKKVAAGLTPHRTDFILRGRQQRLGATWEAILRGSDGSAFARVIAEYRLLSMRHATGSVRAAPGRGGAPAGALPAAHAGIRTTGTNRPRASLPPRTGGAPSWPRPRRRIAAAGEPAAAQRRCPTAPGPAGSRSTGRAVSPVRPRKQRRDRDVETGGRDPLDAPAGDRAVCGGPAVRAPTARRGRGRGLNGGRAPCQNRPAAGSQRRIGRPHGMSALAAR